MTGAGGSSELLQAGYVQKAFTRLIEEYPDGPSTETFKNYVIDSAESVSTFLGNASKDTTYPLDRFSNGNALIQLSKTSENTNISTALAALRTSLDLQPRNADGGLWYYVYPYWSYLDGMFSYAPFYAEYTKEIAQRTRAAAIEDIFHQLNLLREHCLIASSGLLVHGYDYSKTAVWANPSTGASPHVWGRSLGWYAMALVDTLEIMRDFEDSDGWKDLQCNMIELLLSIAASVDATSGAWWQVMDRPAAEKNYIESSGSAMFVYALLRARRLDLLRSKTCIDDNKALPHIYTTKALRAYNYIVDNFVVNNNNGTLGYNGTVSVCSLNSTASYEVISSFLPF